MADQEKKSVFLNLLREQADKEGKLKPEDAKPSPSTASAPSSDKPNLSKEDVQAELDKFVKMFGGDPSNPSFESFSFHAQLEGVLEKNGKDIDELLPRMFQSEQLVDIINKQMGQYLQEVSQYKNPTEAQKAVFREEIAALSILNQLPSHKEVYLKKLRENYDKTDDLTLLVGMKLGQLASLAFTKATAEAKTALGEAAKHLNQKLESVVRTAKPKQLDDAPSARNPEDIKEGLNSLVKLMFLKRVDEAVEQVGTQLDQIFKMFIGHNDFIKKLTDELGKAGADAIETIQQNQNEYLPLFRREIGMFGIVSASPKQTSVYLDVCKEQYEKSNLEQLIACKVGQFFSKSRFQEVAEGLDNPDEVKKALVQAQELLDARTSSLLEEDQAKPNEQDFQNAAKSFFESMAPTLANTPDEPVKLSDWEWKDKAPYEIHENFVENAKGILSNFEQIANQVVKAVEQKLRDPSDDLEDYFKHIYYRMVIDYHLKIATFIQPGLMSTLLRLADDTGRSYLKPIIHFGHQKMMLATMFQELIVPVGRGKDVQAQLHKFSGALVSQHYPIHDSHELAEAVLTNGKLDKAKLIDVFMQWSVFIQSAMSMQLAQTGYLKGFIDESPKATTNMKEADVTWVVYCLNHALESWKQFGKRGLDHYPNQGPNIALLFCFLGHVINMDVDIDESSGAPIASGMKPRYELSQLPKLSGKENLMTAQSGSLIFERMI
ncbi:MAG TPA: hypothetical protein VM577_09290 [Anaerovoracaceae bacterium]|nr:hypothetical protein [Anaerovoracaceae bacterium]